MWQQIVLTVIEVIAVCAFTVPQHQKLHGAHVLAESSGEMPLK